MAWDFKMWGRMWNPHSGIKMTVEEYYELLASKKTPLNTGVKFEKIVDAFYKEFECERCGHCCTKLSEIELEKSERKKYKHIKRDGKYFMPMPCTYYDNGCKIYNSRPTVCRRYPLIKISGVAHISTRCKGAKEICLKLIQRRFQIVRWNIALNAASR